MGLPDIDTIPDTGAVFTTGRSRFADNVASHFFIRKDPVIAIACGDEHSAVVCQSGRVFVFGSNDWGQLGLGHKNHVSKPSCVKILKPEKVSHVACGRAHTLICTARQKIFACGSDQEGQLGRGTSAVGDSSSSPVLIYDCGLAGPKIIQVAAGSHHSMALTSDGGVIAWGSNLEGQLGLPGISGLVNTPTKVPIPEPVKLISTGYYHSAFLTESGIIYVCGESESGKLGIEISFSTQVAPKQMQLPCLAAHVACGGHHTLILAENGELYCTGSNVNGQLGMGTTVTEVQTPKLVTPEVLQDEVISQIACGESHSAILTESGKLFTCGDGRHGKLGLEENENNVHELTFAVKYQELVVTNVACGGCHTILVGHRYEGNSETQREKEHAFQKKNTLPPLKLPINKLQNDVHSENTNDTEQSKSKHEESSTDKSDEKIIEHIKTETIEITKDSENNSTTKEMSDHPSKGSTKITEIKETETIKVSDNKENTNNNGLSITKIDAENNMKNDDNAETKQDAETHNLASGKGTPDKEITSERNNDRNKSPEKHLLPSPTPPPKPPRLKSDNKDNSIEEVSPTNKPSTKKEEEKHNTIVSNKINVDPEEQDVTHKTDETSKNTMEEEESSPAKSSSSKSIKSQKSKAGTDETAEMENQNVIKEAKEHEKEKIINDEKTENNTTPDDADVIHSPISKAGKVQKLFKSKKHQETENGTKAGNTVNPKSKSKTCILL